MSTVKIINSGYKSSDDMRNLINYVIEDPKHQIDGMIGGNMILTGTASFVYDQMMDIKEQYRKTDGYMMRHIIISLSDYEMQYINSQQLYIIATKICMLFPEYQSTFAIHLETGRLHIHIAINTVSYVSGRKLQMPYISSIKKEIHDIVSAYCPEISLTGLAPTTYETSTFEEMFENAADF